ncbi:hypothetical protein Y032_0025g1198 [Ancylostoma ceylanicum]|uniref:Uncharacterized protein n=1 Tax=Ancylostoma ceylanicum TaxID=53326 RepID=A0A016UVW4_9BILA|nr:hypothetical protein Y032_0025g1198 [Ancylostoma ceylanicum]
MITKTYYRHLPRKLVFCNVLCQEPHMSLFYAEVTRRKVCMKNFSQLMVLLSFLSEFFPNLDFYFERSH